MQQARIVAENRKKGMFAARQSNGCLSILIALDDVDVGDLVIGHLLAVGSPPLHNATKSQRLRVIVSHLDVPAEALWQHLFFDSIEDFAAANPGS